MAKLNVYGWLGPFPQGFPKPEHRRHVVQSRTVVAATSLTEVMRVGGFKRSFLPYVGETKNDVEVAIAMSKPGTKFFEDSLNHKVTESVYYEWPEGDAWDAA